jgi:hypothetical protein
MAIQINGFNANTVIQSMRERQLSVSTVLTACRTTYTICIYIAIVITSYRFMFIPFFVLWTRVIGCAQFCRELPDTV